MAVYTTTLSNPIFAPVDLDRERDMKYSNDANNESKSNVEYDEKSDTPRLEPMHVHAQGTTTESLLHEPVHVHASGTTTNTLPLFGSSRNRLESLYTHTLFFIAQSYQCLGKTAMV